MGDMAHEEREKLAADDIERWIVEYKWPKMCMLDLHMQFVRERGLLQEFRDFIAPQPGEKPFGAEEEE